MNTGNHKGGREDICDECSLGEKKAHRCLFYNKDGTLTRYAFSCGYVEKHGNKNMGMRHGVFHVDGQDINGNSVNKSFATVKPARAFLRARGEDEQINSEEV
jgi:hypothetical protein